MTLIVNKRISIPEQEIKYIPIRAQGAGGQNVNKVASAIHLRFDIVNSSLPELCKERLLNSGDSPINSDGIIVIKAQQHRTQERNKQDARQRLIRLIQGLIQTPKRRRKTAPSKAARQRRTDKKTQRGRIKALRKKIVS